MPIPVLAFPDKKRKKGKEKKYLQLRYTAPALKRIGEAPRRGVDKGAKGKKIKQMPNFFLPPSQSIHEWGMQQTRFNPIR